MKTVEVNWPHCGIQELHEGLKLFLKPTGNFVFRSNKDIEYIGTVAKIARKYFTVDMYRSNDPEKIMFTCDFEIQTADYRHAEVYNGSYEIYSSKQEYLTYKEAKEKLSLIESALRSEPTRNKALIPHSAINKFYDELKACGFLRDKQS